MELHLPGFRRRYGEAAEALIATGAIAGDHVTVDDHAYAEFLKAHGQTPPALPTCPACGAIVDGGCRWRCRGCGFVPGCGQ